MSDEMGPSITFSDESSKFEEVCSALTNCVRVPMMIGVATPFIAWMGLYVVKPSFVMKKDIANNFQEIDAWKMLLWIVVITVVVWVIIFCWERFYGKDAGRICLSAPDF